MTRSALDGIAGLGETRKKRLLKHFGSVKRIREASLEELEAVPTLPKKVAAAVHEALHNPAANGRRAS
jgi:excinuclease ABC subunit C